MTEEEELSISWYDFTHPNVEMLRKCDEMLKGISFRYEDGCLVADIPEIEVDW